MKLTNVTYGSGADTVTSGLYAFLMIGEATDSPTVAAINKLDFPWCDGSESVPQFDTRSVFGAEHMFGMPIFDDITIDSTSQLIVVGEYNEPVNINDTGDHIIDMQAGFAEEYFV